MSYRREAGKSYGSNPAKKHRAPGSSQKKDVTQETVKGILKRANVRGGEHFCQELLRKVETGKERVDPRSFDPREHGIIQVQIEGNPRTKVFMRPHNLQIIDTSCNE